MGIILKLSLRNMNRRKTRYILTAIALVISVALFGGVLIVSDSFEVMMIDTIDKQLGSADILFKPANSTDGWFNPDDVNNQIEGLDHVQAVSYRISGFNVYISSTDSGNINTDATRTGIYGLDVQDNDEKLLGGQPYIIDSLNDGTTIEDLLSYDGVYQGKGIIVISQSIRVKLGSDFNVNDSVWILPHDYNQEDYYPEDTGSWDEYTVVGVIRDVGEAQDFDVNSTEDESDFFATGLGITSGPGIFLKVDDARYLSNGSESHAGEYNLGVIGTDDLYAVASVKENVQDILTGLNDEKDWKTNDLKTDSIEQIQTTMATLETTFLIFGIIALILSMVLMMNIFNIIRKEQEYETGMFQAIGASKSETFKMFLTQGLIMGLIGSIIGTVASYFISYVIFSIVIQMLQVFASTIGGLTIETFTIVLLPQTIVVTFLIGFITSIIASIYPSWKASRKPIIECLNPIEEKSKRFKKHYVRRIALFILGGLLIFYGFFLIFTSSESNGDTIAFGGGGTSSGIVTNMFAPILILFGIIWTLALCLKPLNKVVVNVFKPYLRRTKLLTENNILRHRKRTALTFIMITLTTSFLIGISTMMASISAGIDTTIDEFMGANIRIYTYGTPRSFETDLLNYSGVDNIMGVSHQNARFLIDDEWIGHGYLESDYTESISVNIIDTTRIKQEMRDTTILSPSTKTIDDIMDDIESGNNIIITEEFADDYNVEAGDVIPVNFTLGVTFENADRLIAQDLTNAREDTYLVNMTVSAIIKDLKGFSTTDLLSLGGGVKQYHSFVSWTTYDKIAVQNLPGGGTDIIFRQMADTGDLYMDAVTPNWFNISEVEAILSGISGIDYYTSRNDYFTPTYYGTFPAIQGLNPLSSVVGIHTNSSGNLTSDTYFGNNTLIGGTGSTMEELLNTSENVCIIDERYAAATSLGIDDYVYIFPNAFTLQNITTGMSNTEVDYSSANYSATSGDEDDLTSSDASYLSFVSNGTTLAFNITTQMSMVPFNIYKASEVSIETMLNATVNNLTLQVFNILTNEFDTIGNINNTAEQINNISFNLNQFYINPLTTDIILRVLGENSTNNDFYNLSINYLKFEVLESNETIDNWPAFRIVEIIETPTYYNTERYSWFAGSEGFFNVSSDSPIYISYEKSRDLIYPDYSSPDIYTENVNYVLIHCNNVENITVVKNEILNDLNTLSFINSEPYWTALEPKNQTLQNRLNVFDWFVWIQSDASDEQILDGMLAFIEDEGYVVIFSFTKTFMQSTFNTMINLITFLTNALLIFCIVIAMIGLVLHSLLTTMARRREIGMLRSIGLSRKGVIRSISGETYVLSVLGLSAGILAGLYLGWLMVETIPGGGFLAVTFTIPWITVVLLIAAVVITVILSSRFPARWAARLNIIDAVRTR